MNAHHSTILATTMLALIAAPGSAGAADFDAEALHGKFTDAFNNRQWQELEPLLAEGVVFHRANAAEVDSGSDAVLGTFEQTIGGEWNVTFVQLASEDQFTGKNGRVVERGDFAITAGAADDSCYRGSYLMTWAPQEDDWKLQTLTWQDVQTELENCKR